MGTVVPVGASGGAAIAGDIPAANPRESSTGSRHLVFLACIERLLGVVRGNAPWSYWSARTCSMCDPRRVNTYIG
ncbi:hypothetical protein GCM10029978_005340 [Actinoallomurus acanthiterrae]